MIINADSPKAELENVLNTEPADFLDSEPPPVYEARRSSVVSDLKPVNHISISRKVGSIEGSFTIDATMQIPDVLLSPLEPGETEESRKHLRLETKSGSIRATVVLLDPPLERSVRHKSGRVEMELRAPAAGSVTLALHASDSSTRLRFHLTASSRSGSITIQLPRSVCGNMVISVPFGFVNVSRAVAGNLTTISEVGHTRRCFVGDVAKLDAPATTAIDEVYIETRLGNVTLLYVDETVATLLGGGDKDGGFIEMSSGLFGRILSRWS